MAQPRYQLNPEQKVGNYKIITPLAVGGMGEVYQAIDQNLSRPTVIKLILPNLAKDENSIQRFYSEAKYMAQIKSKYVASIYFFGLIDELPTIAMEYIGGRELSDITKNLIFPEKEARDLTLQLIHGLKDIHEAHILHRDIKPQNIKLQRNFVAKFLDFGIAKSLDEGHQNLTEANYKMGTPLWMAPELRYGAPESFQTDIWSLGATVYYLLSGYHPFFGDLNAVGQLVDISPKAFKTTQFIGADEVSKVCSKELLAVVTKMINPEPEYRYKTCLEIERDLLAIKPSKREERLNHSIFFTSLTNQKKVDGWLSRHKLTCFQKKLTNLHALESQTTGKTKTLSTSDSTVALSINNSDVTTEELELKHLVQAKAFVDKLIGSGGKGSMDNLWTQAANFVKNPTGKNSFSHTDIELTNGSPFSRLSTFVNFAWENREYIAKILLALIFAASLLIFATVLLPSTFSILGL